MATIRLRKMMFPSHRGTGLLTLLAILLGTLAAPAQKPLELIKKAGKGALYRCGEQKILVVRGTPEEMGRQHGELLAPEVRQVVTETLAWTSRVGLPRTELARIARKFNPHLPDRYAAEMRGLAKGSGLPLEEIVMVHAMPSKFHCSGAAVAGSMTVDGKLYHTRSLDYALDIGTKGRLQDHALLIVRQPDDGIASAVPAWAGFLGSVTGMNLRGITVGEMGSSSSDEDYAGVPMIFMIREVLHKATKLSEAVALFEKGPRTCGYNFIVGSGAERKAVAIEENRGQFQTFAMGDKKENVAPHFAIPDAVRRSNHFVNPELAKTQRSVYDPRKSRERSWMLYEAISNFLLKHKGRLDGPRMIEQLRLYPSEHGCLHQAVMAGSDKVIYISQAKDGRVFPFAGAQNMTFYRYDVATILRAPEEVKVQVFVPRGGLAAAPERRLKVTQHSAEYPCLATIVQSSNAGNVWRYRIDPKWVSEKKLAAPPYRDLELHEPRRVKKGSPGLLIFSTGNQRMLVARTLARALARLGTPVAIVQSWRPGQPRAPFVPHNATRFAPQIMPKEVDRTRMVWMGIGLGGDVLFQAQGGGPKRPPLIFAFATGELGKLWARNEGAKSLVKLLSVDPAEFKNIPTELRIQSNTPWNPPPRNLQNPVLFFGLKREKLLPVEDQEKLIEPYENAKTHWLNVKFKRVPMHLPDIVTKIRVFLKKSTAR